MFKIAVMMVEGFEEAETLVTANVLRRAGLHCDLISLEEPYVKGMYGVVARADKIWNEEIHAYDMLILPGGSPAGDILRGNAEIRKLIQEFHRDGKYLAGICYGVLAMSEAGVMKGVRTTGYTGYEEKLPDSIFVKEPAVADGRIVTGQGPAATLAFAFKILDVLGIDAQALKEKMLY